ncbi:hypothetical protein NC652_039275 [Populus alba x Populus x berolinensis]|uniref:Uncharacterized protein n=1 Tax=Populus alba x Populus x berolinensis TaxID=444605 RepID=A0AAD6PR42_9ROSI|nr:hypothetical protein NC652_039275 [Populus alba x Populus x berolinensis]KAJ6957264.1 hypothetical protein NC653_039257 [Populus alba x Populus x berolinensis]
MKKAKETICLLKERFSAAFRRLQLSGVHFRG